MSANLFPDSVFRVVACELTRLIIWSSSSLAVLEVARAIDRALASTVRGLGIALAGLGDAHAADRASTRNPGGQPDPYTKPEEARPTDRASTRNPSVLLDSRDFFPTRMTHWDASPIPRKRRGSSSRITPPNVPTQ